MHRGIREAISAAIDESVLKSRLASALVGCGDAIRDIVFNAAQSAALSPSKETPGLVPDSASCPADVLTQVSHCAGWEY